MHRFTTSSAMVVVAACCALFPSVAVGEPGEAGPAATETLNLGLRGVYFVPNQGQWSDSEVHYGLRSRGLDVAFRESSFTMHLRREKGEDAKTFVEIASDAREETAAEYDTLTLGVTFPGSNPVLPEGAQLQVAKFNYFVGGERRGVASNVPSFGSVVYADLYDGIDLHVMGNDDGVLKYEFHVAPGMDYSQIRIAYDGVESLCIDDSGDLHINTSFGTLTDGAPVAWQEAGGRTVPAVAGSEAKAASDDGRDACSTNAGIPARFELCDAHTYRIALDGPVDPTRELIIDPDVQWMTYLGGRGADYGHDLAVDSAGNALVTGYTSSTDFEGMNNAHHGGIEDAFVVKVSASGALQWMTFLGGSDDEQGYGIAVDGAGNALVTGYTASTDFEGKNNAHHGGVVDAFAVRVSASGALQWMTYLGGDGGEGGYGTALDSTGNVLVAGYTSSTDFEGMTNAHHGGTGDAFVVKVSDRGTVLWMTYLGGSGTESSSGIAVDGADNALVTGHTISTDFEGRNNSHHGGIGEAFVVKVSPSGVPQWMTYLGGNSEESGSGIAVDSAADALVTGSTSSSNFEGRNNAHHGGAQDAFVVKVSASGALQWMIFLGGSNDETGLAIAMDSGDNALVTGYTYSSDFEGRTNEYRGGYDDAFVVTVSPSGDLRWMTFFGGSDRWEDGYGIAVDSAGNALVTGTTSSTDFEGRNNAYRGGRFDAYVVQLRLADGPELSVTATCPSGGPIRVSWSGATGRGLAGLIFAGEEGAFVLPPRMPCAGTPLGLGYRQLQVVWTGNTDPDGSGSIGRVAGPNACGGYLQLLDLTTCETSNAARLE